MKRYWYSIHERAVESVAVWKLAAPAFVVGELTLELHQAVIASLDTMLQAQSDAEMALGRIRAGRDTSYRTLTDLCTRGCQIIRGSLSPEESLRAEVRHVRGVRQESQGALLGRCQRLVSLWQKVDESRAALTPPQPALLVGTIGLEAFQGLLADHSGLLQSVEDLLAEMKSRKHALRKVVTQLDQYNKRWYEAWKGQFPAGSPERNMLRQVTTGPKRHEPAQAVVLSAEVLPDGRVRLAFDAARATSFTLWHRGPQEEEFTEWPERIPLKTLTTEPLPPGEHAWKLIAHNSVGDGEESAITVVQVPQAVAA